MQSQTALYIIRIQKLLEVKVPVLQLDILKLFRKSSKQTTFEYMFHATH